MTIALTIGDCNGIGPECGLKSLKYLLKHEKELLKTHSVNFAVISGRRTLLYWVELQNSFEPEPVFSVEGQSIVIADQHVQWIETDSDPLPTPGTCNLQSGELAYEALQRSVDGVKSGQFDAVVTLPVHKFALQQAGYPYPGQTEFYAAHDEHADGIMMLMGDGLRVALATVHIPLKSVAEHIRRAHVATTLQSLAQTLRRDFACSTPRIAVLGLNPHAGEQGLMGNEEEEIVFGMQMCRDWATTEAVSLDIEGPFPADGFFARQQWKQFDAVLAMYHDQGLIPVKMVAGTTGVNYTTGLSFVRTSPDHGTAEGIAGTNSADERSTVSAIRTAIEIAENRTTFDITNEHKVS